MAFSGSGRAPLRAVLAAITVVLIGALGALLPMTLAGAAVPLKIRPMPGGSGASPPGQTPAMAGPDYNTCASRGVICYSPRQLRHAYGISSRIAAGDVGTGQSIVIIDSFGSPTISADLQTFDQSYGLPAPPRFDVLSPLGTVPFDSTNNTMVGWAEETTLDVEWAHAIAPGAKLVLLTSPVAETEGVHGLPQFLQLEQYVLQHHLGKIISQSWGATENTLFTSQGRTLMGGFDSFYKRADANRITVFSSSGDTGSANVNRKGGVYPFPTVDFPASSPWATSVGGTSLHSNQLGRYLGETVWNDGSAQNGGATGGGVSQFEKEPGYQKGLSPNDQSILKLRRGLPDIAMNADPLTAVPIYTSFPGIQAGFHLVGGTSEGSPVWAGIVADLNQYLGKPVGFLNPALYKLGLAGQLNGAKFHDITIGNNSFLGIPGYSATSGWDPTTGWGTPDLVGLPAALSKAEQH